MAKTKKLSIFAVAIAIAFAFTFCDNQLESVYVPKNDGVSLSIRTQNVEQTVEHLWAMREMYESGKYDELFDEFSAALSCLLFGFWGNKFVLQEFGIRRSNTILLKHLLDERNEHSAYIKNALRERLFCNLEIFLEHFQNMQISFEGNVEGILEVAGHKTNIAVVFRSFDYLQGNTNVLNGYTLSQFPFQTNNIEFCNDIFNCKLVIVIEYDVLIAINYLSFTGFKSDPNEEIVLTPEMFDFVGQAHNDALDYVFYNVILPWQHGRYDKLTFELAESAIFDFFSNHFKILAALKSSSGILPAENFSENRKLVTSDFSTNSLVPENLPVGYISENEHHFLVKLGDIIRADMGLSCKLHAIDELNALFGNRELFYLEDYELISLFVISSIASHSLQYWYGEGGVKWNSALDILSNNEFTIRSGSSANWGSIAFADVRGAAVAMFRGGGKAFKGGMIGGGITGTVIAGPVGTKPGALIGGTVAVVSFCAPWAAIYSLIAAAGQGGCSGLTVFIPNEPQYQMFRLGQACWGSYLFVNNKHPVQYLSNVQ